MLLISINNYDNKYKIYNIQKIKMFYKNLEFLLQIICFDK